MEHAFLYGEIYEKIFTQSFAYRRYVMRSVRLFKQWYILLERDFARQSRSGFTENFL